MTRIRIKLVAYWWLPHPHVLIFLGVMVIAHIKRSMTDKWSLREWPAHPLVSKIYLNTKIQIQSLKLLKEWSIC